MQLHSFLQTREVHTSATPLDATSKVNLFSSINYDADLILTQVHTHLSLSRILCLQLFRYDIWWHYHNTTDRQYLLYEMLALVDLIIIAQSHEITTT